MSCSNCGSTGNLSQTCATKLSQIVWDGGSLCNGYSGTSVVDAILSLAQSVCNLNNEWSAFAVTSDDVALSGTYVKGCFTTDVAGTLTTWLNEAVTKICALTTIIPTTTNVTELDGTLVLHYETTTSTVATSGAYGTLKSYSIPADTFNEDYEYLLVEFSIGTTTYDGISNVRLSLDGNVMTTWALSPLDPKPGILGMRCFVNLNRSSANTVKGDYHLYYSKMAGRWSPNWGWMTQATPLTFTAPMTLLIEGHNSTAPIWCELFRITKVRKSIIY